MRSAIVLGVLSILTCGPAARADEADLKPDVRALEERFTVVKQRYDAGKRQYVLVLEARLSSDRPCHFDASFRDADDKEVRAVKVEFADGGRQTNRGERYTATVKYPTRQAMQKVTQVVLTKSD